MKDMLHRLESTLMELGAEVYSLKHRLKEATDNNTELVAAFKALQALLDERGLVEQDDFAVAINMSKLADEGTTIDSEYRKILDDVKKIAH